MIKYDLPQKPEKLTKELQEQLTQKFKKTQDRVWDIDWLKKAIAAKSFGKCCYSDIRLNEEGKYMEVEHFLPKNKYPDLVLEWQNLNPSCKPCNVKKGEHDPNIAYIVNPFNDNPKEFLYFNASLYQGKDEKGIGNKTIEVLDLNNREQFVKKRVRVNYEIIDILKEIDSFLFPEKISYCIKKLKNLMRKGNRKEEYSALTATIILENSYFKNIETHLKENNLWDKELQELKSELEFCALPNPQIIHNL
jgi:uncharacterized protein (TIGR02646 family)